MRNGDGELEERERKAKKGNKPLHNIIYAAYDGGVYFRSQLLTKSFEENTREN